MNLGFRVIGAARPPGGRKTWCPIATALSIALILHPGTAVGQSRADRVPVTPVERVAGRSSSASDLAFLGGNVALGGLTAALIQKWRGGSFWAAFLDGALGGAVAYGGKRLAVERFYGAGLAGRQVAAVGTSMVRNASDGRGALDQLVLPFGFARLYLRRDATSPIPLEAQIKLDVPTVLTATFVALWENADFDVSASVSAGALVFVGRERWEEESWIGTQAAGVLWLRGNPDDPYPDVERSAVFAHERVHVTQYDFSFLAWGDPIESPLIERIPSGAWIDRHFDLGLNMAAWGLANWLVSHDRRPWEREARFLTRVSSSRE